MSKKVLIVGGVAGGASVAARVRRLDESAEVIMFERGPNVSFSNCCLPYHLSGEVEKCDDLVLMCPEKFDSQYNIEARVLNEVTEIKREENKVVVTVMSNLGLKQAFEKNGVIVEETQVGDRYVLERMRNTGAILGGEQSGHIIFLEHNTTGDGILAALKLLEVIKKNNKSLKELAQQMEKLPQVLVNVPVKQKEAWQYSISLGEKIRSTILGLV